MLRNYYYLTKPGIIYGNTLTAIAGFLLASGTSIDTGLLLATVSGTVLVIASGCVINNYFDQDIDRKMSRTKSRALIKGSITNVQALIFGTSLGILGFYVLVAHVNTLTAIIGLIGFVDYAFIYTYSKRKTVHSTIIGSVAGATSLVAGYTAVTGQLDSAVLALFLIMATLQMPHFYAIGIYRKKDYQAANLPILPVVKGIKQTKIQIAAYIMAFIASCWLLALWGYTGYFYLAVVTALGWWWLKLALNGFKAENDVKWARQIFLRSLVVILVISVAIPLGASLP